MKPADTKIEELATKTTAAPAPGITIESDRIILTRPVIEWQGYVWPDQKDSRGNQTRLAPQAAFIVHGMVVIEELGMIVPVSYVKIIRYDAVAVAPAKVS